MPYSLWAFFSFRFGMDRGKSLPEVGFQFDRVIGPQRSRIRTYALQAEAMGDRSCVHQHQDTVVETWPRPRQRAACSKQQQEQDDGSVAICEHLTG